MNVESCRQRQPSDGVVLSDVTTRRYDYDDDEDVIGDYSGHLAVARATPSITVQSAAREPGRRGTWPDDLSTSGLWSKPNRKSMKPKPEIENGSGHFVDVGHVCRLLCVVSAQLVVSALL